MAVPRNRHSNGRKNSKRAHHAKKEQPLIDCSNCGKIVRYHHMCPFCGYYKGRPVLKDKEKEDESNNTH